MAMYDWNHNGKNDMQDNFLEYQIYKDCTNKSSYTPRGKGISNFGTALCIVGAFVVLAVVFMILGIDAENVPGIVIFILLVIIEGVLICFANKHDI